MMSLGSWVSTVLQNWVKMAHIKQNLELVKLMMVGVQLQGSKQQQTQQGHIHLISLDQVIELSTNK